MTPRQRKKIKSHNGELVIVRALRDGQLEMNARGRLVTDYGIPWYVRVRGNPEDTCSERGVCDCVIRLLPAGEIHLTEKRTPRAKTLVIQIGK